MQFFFLYYSHACLTFHSDTTFTKLSLFVHATMFLETDFFKMIEWVALVNKSLSGCQFSLVFNENHF